MVKSIRGIGGFKKGQFYIIAAVIIIFVIIGLAVVTNSVSVRKQPTKFYDLGDILKTEGIQVVQYSEYSQSNVNDNLNLYLDLFSSYIQTHTTEDFSLVILYGDATGGGNVQGKVLQRTTEGGVSVSISGGQPITVTQQTDVTIGNTAVTQNDDNTVNVTLTSSDGINITQTLPVLQDNNFVFVMTSSQGLNQYIQTSVNETRQD